MPKTSDKSNASPNNTAIQGWRMVAPYFYLTIIGFIVGLFLVWLMLWKVQTLTALGLTGKFFYLILIPLGLSVAAVLFGILRSFARYRGRQLGGTLELGGPVVVFVLVILLGFWLAPNTGNFPFTIYVHGESGNQDLALRNAGYVMLDLGGERRKEPIGDKGQVLFSEIPASFRGQPVKVALDADGYELINPKQEFRLEGPNLYLPIRKKPGQIIGHVQDEQGHPLAGVDISVAGLSTTTDHNGGFEFTIPGNRLQKEFTLKANAAGFVPWSGSVAPNANDATIVLNHVVAR